ncbi:MAG: hypothetical protein AAF078_11675 [Planctomycetota bacterium]
MMHRMVFLTAASLLTMAGAAALIYGGPRGWVVGGASAVLAGYAGVLASAAGDR